MAMQKGALKVHELLFLTFQAFLPSEPSARVDGLNTVETPLKAARNFAEALTTLRTWRQQVATVVADLKANPEPLKLFNSLKILISNLTSSDNAFAIEVSQMYRSTQIKTTCTDKALLDCWRSKCLTEQGKMMRIEEEEVKPTWLPHHLNHLLMLQMLPQMLRKERKGKPKGGGKGEKRTVCQECLTDKGPGCPKGDQCPHAHPRKAGKCLRCGATGHGLASCRRPARDPKTRVTSSTKRSRKRQRQGKSQA